MLSKVFPQEGRSIFKRKTMLLSSRPVAANGTQAGTGPVLEDRTASLNLDQECTALVINSSQEMAKEITLQLTLRIPGCSIMYAPTIETAKWILSRRKINLVVSSPLLPDGSIARLKEVLEKMETPADLVVVGNLNARSAEILGSSSYQCRALRRIDAKTPPDDANPRLQAKIKNLGADIRNDLNNPLQEIVAMVFVARSGADSVSVSDCALDAIEKAAKNMSKLVNSLEDKIRCAMAANPRS